MVATATAAAVAFSNPAGAAVGAGQMFLRGDTSAAADSYIVVFKDTAVPRADVQQAARDLAARNGGSVVRDYQHALRGFEARLPATAARRLAADPLVRYVEQNQTVTVDDIQTPPSWGLDRIDQRNLPLDNTYRDLSRSGVRAYVIDTGIRFSHLEFGGRAVSGFDAIDGGAAADCHGHGTHVAGTVGGGTFGVAKGVTLVGVRVLGCDGSGTVAEVIAGIDWVTADHDPGEPAVANMSLGGGISQALNDAVAASVADGVTYGVAAGNENQDACNSSPASTPEAITVGATTSTDARAPYSNFGGCLDIFGPGSAIRSAWHSSDISATTLSGTSMATPHVVGAAALVLAGHPAYTPQQVRDELVSAATAGVVTDPGPGSPNNLVYIGYLVPPLIDFSLAATASSGVVEPGGATTTTINTYRTGTAPMVSFGPVGGLPEGVTASFSRSPVRAGYPTTMTISTTSAVAPGSYPLTVTAVGDQTTHAISYTLTVVAVPSCTQTNGTDVEIPDLGTAESQITISGCGNATSASTVEVHVGQTGDELSNELSVSLIAPDGSAYPLDVTGNPVNETYVLDLSTETAVGTWKLQVHDATSAITLPAAITGWTLNLTGAVSDCMSTNDTDSAFSRGSLESSLTIQDCVGNASAATAVEVHVVHPQPVWLTVTLVAPDGSSYVLRDHVSDGRNINTVYYVDLSGEPRNGTWTLRITDSYNTLEPRYLDRWTLSLGDPPAPWWTVVDNSSTSFQASANWGTTTDSAQRYGADFRFANPETVSDVAWYSADLPVTGIYQVEVWYPAGSTYNDRTPYIMRTTSGNQSVYVDQRSGGGRWVNLGTFSMTSGAHTVAGVSRWTGGTGYVAADAIRISRLS